jgi:hypothetical protein
LLIIMTFLSLLILLLFLGILNTDLDKYKKL